MKLHGVAAVNAATTLFKLTAFDSCVYHYTTF